MAILLHVSTIIEDEGVRILLVREAKKIHGGKWNLPGGHIELGEHPGEAAVREVMEETGLDVRLTHLLGIYSGISKAIQSIRFTFIGEPVSGSAATPGDEIMEVRWMSLQELEAMEDHELVGVDVLRVVLRDYQLLSQDFIAVLREINVPDRRIPTMDSTRSNSR